MALAGWLAARWDEAREWATRAHDVFAALGDQERLGWTLLDLAAVDHYTGRDPSARLREAERLFGEVGFPRGTGLDGEPAGSDGAPPGRGRHGHRAPAHGTAHPA